MDVTQLILDDHQEQRRMFAILEQIDRVNTPALSAIWSQLANSLHVHAKAEELLLYPELLRVGQGAGGRETSKDETLHAIRDHNEIRDAIEAVATFPVGTDAWHTAVAEANKANSDHMAEEEREGLTDFRHQATLQSRHDLAVQFAYFEASHVNGVQSDNQPPEDYVSVACRTSGA